MSHGRRWRAVLGVMVLSLVTWGCQTAPGPRSASGGAATSPAPATPLPPSVTAGPGNDLDALAQVHGETPGTTATAAQRQKQAKAYLQAAREQLTGGNLDEALRLFEAAIEENPKLLEAYLGVGQIYRDRESYEKAAAAYERATVIAPTSFEAHYYLALTRQMMGQFDAAVRAYLYALAIDPGSFEANLHLASCYLQMGRAAEAVPYARRATELKRNSQPAWANLATAYSLMNLYEKAVRAYREASELGDLQEPILLGLAEAHNRLGHYERAVAVLKTTITRFPSAVAHERMGYALFKQREYEKALAEFRAALLFDPTDTAALNGLGVCMMTKYIVADRRVLAHHEEALQAWQRSLELRPNQPRIAALVDQFARL